MTAANQVSIGIVGAGFIGKVHAQAMKSMPEIRVAGVADERPDKARELGDLLGVPAVTSAEELLDRPDLDAVDICLPTSLHKKYTVAALNAGKHVLCEKPMAFSVEEADDMIAAARARDRHLMIAHVLRFWPEYVALKEWLESGEGGRPLALLCERRGARPKFGAGNWFMDQGKSGGTILDMLIHDLDYCTWLFGSPLAVWARAQRGETGTVDYASISLIYKEGGPQVHVEGGWGMPDGYPFVMAARLLCEKGSAEFVLGGFKQVDERQGAGGTVEIFGPGRRTVQTEPGDAYAAEIQYFARSILAGKAPYVATPESARLTLKVARAALRSVDTGQTVLV